MKIDTRRTDLRDVWPRYRLDIFTLSKVCGEGTFIKVGV